MDEIILSSTYIANIPMKSIYNIRGKKTTARVYVIKIHIVLVANRITKHSNRVPNSKNIIKQQV